MASRLPAWGTLKAAALKRRDVAALHRRVGATHPCAANRVLEIISKMFELARLWGIVEEDHPNPGRRIEAFHEVKRERWVTAEEMPRLGAAICLYLLTGVRKNELLNARWRDIDWHRAEGHCRKPKTANLT